MHAGQVPGAGQVHVPGPARRPGRGLIGVQGGGGLQQLPDPVHEPAGLHQRGRPAADPGYSPGGNGDASELAQQQRRPVYRNVVAGGQVRGLRAGLRPEAGTGPDLRGQLSFGDRPAARAFLGLRHILSDLRRRRRLDVGDLMTALHHDRLAGQARAAPAARRRRALEPLIRVIHQAHRRPRAARLLTRPPFPPLPQRPVRALLLIRAVRRRRPRGRGRVLPGLALQLPHPGRQPLVLRGQLADQLVRLSQPRRQLAGRQHRKLLSGRNTRHTRHNWQ